MEAEDAAAGAHARAAGRGQIGQLGKKRALDTGHPNWRACVQHYSLWDDVFQKELSHNVIHIREAEVLILRMHTRQPRRGCACLKTRQRFQVTGGARLQVCAL